jgi:hypothetical protein
MIGVENFTRFRQIDLLLAGNTPWSSTINRDKSAGRNTPATWESARTSEFLSTFFYSGGIFAS